MEEERQIRLQSKESQIPQQKPTVIKSAASMALGTLLSRILGFVRDAVFFALFARTFTDAYAVAFRLPNLFRRLLGEGSLSVSFIPVYIENRHSKELADATFSILLAVTLTLSLLGVIFMDSIVGTLVGDPTGFAAIAGKLELTVMLARTMMFYLMLVAIYAFFSAIANTHHYFFIPAIGPTIFNAFNILFFLTPWGGDEVRQQMAAWGVIAGGIAQVLVVAGLLYKKGYLPKFTFSWKRPDLVQVFKGLAPSLLGIGVFQLMTLVNTFFASSLGEGSQSYIYAADRLLELPQSLLAVSLGSALLPRFSEHVSNRQIELLKSEAMRSLKMILFLALPAGLGLLLLARPIVQVLFERGEFGPQDVEQTARLLEVYSGLLIVSSISRVSVPIFYALKNTWLPAVIALVVLFLHIGFCQWLLPTYGLLGLAMATTFSALVNALALQLSLHFYVGAFAWGRIFLYSMRFLPGLFAIGRCGIGACLRICNSSAG